MNNLINMDDDIISHRFKNRSKMDLFFMQMYVV